MDSLELAHYLNSNVKKFCLIFNSNYHKRLLQSQLKAAGYKIISLTAEELPELEVLLTRHTLFQKIFYWAPYDSSKWKWLEKIKPTCPIVMEAAKTTCKAADPFQGPSDSQILGNIQQELNVKGCKFTAEGWKTLVDIFKNDKGSLEDPDALKNLALSLGYQFQIVDGDTVRQFQGPKAQIWNLFNMLLLKDKQRTLQAVYILNSDKEAITLCRGLQKMLFDLIDVKEAKKRGLSSDEFATNRGLHPFRAKKMYEQASLLSDKREALLTHFLAMLDLNLKSTRVLSPAEIFRNGVILYLETAE
jgi:hypothetical protein